jgi:hypothetical protein
MKTSKKRTTTPKAGKSKVHSKKASAVRGLNKKEMKGMSGGFNFAAFGQSLASFFAKEITKVGPTIIQDAMKHNWKK